MRPQKIINSDEENVAGTLDRVNLSKNNNFIIVDEKGLIQYLNTDLFAGYSDGDLKSVDEIKSDPDISLIIQSMKFNKTEKLSLEILFYFVEGKSCKDYRALINRVILAGQTYYILFLEENDVFKIFENKINTLQKAMEEGQIPVLIANEDYRINYTTQSFEDILQKGIEDLYDRNIEDVLEGYLDDEQRSSLKKSLRDKKKWSQTIDAVDEKAGLVYFDLHLVPIFDASFRRWSFIFNAYNITDHVIKSRVLEKNETRLRTIINNISDTLFVLKKKDNKTRFEIGNDNFYNLFKIDKDTFLKDNYEDYIEYDVCNTIIKSLGLMEEKGLRSKRYNYYYNTMDKFFEVNVTYVDDEYDYERFYIITLRDNTEKEKYERKLESAFAKEKELNKLKSLILHNMSHELRTPANAIMGYSDIIEDSIRENDYETVHQISKAIREILNKLIGLFTNIIELSEVESGNFEMEKVKINCQQVLQSIYNKKFAEALSKNLEFILEVKDKELFVETDWIKLERVVIALVDNAIKFTKKGSVSLKAYLEDDNVAIEISDTGEGIEDKKIKKMLEPFAQEENFYTRSYEGSGLGLTIAYKLTKLMGGKFKISSSKYKGTKIILLFPSIKVEVKKDFRLTNA